MAENMENGRGEQENQEGNTGQNSGHKHMRRPQKHLDNKINSSQGGREREKDTDQSQSTLEAAWLIPSCFPPFLPRLTATPRQLLLTQLQHISMLHFYSPLSLPLRTWIPFFHTVWLGSIDVDNLDNGVKHHVSKIIIHPKFQDDTADIALLKLASRVTFTSFIRPICLPNITKQLRIPGSCWVTGWGEVKENEGENGQRKGLFYTSPSCTPQHSHSRHIITKANIFLQNQINLLILPISLHIKRLF